MADNNENKVLNVPHLRFPEFSGEWENTELQYIAPNICSGKDKPTSNGTVALYGSTGIIGMTRLASYNEEIVLVARVGANAGQLQITTIPCGVTDNTLIINAKEWNRYIYYYLQHYNLNRLVFGSGQPLITGSMLKKLKIIYGEESERNKIVNLLCLLDERIATQNKIIEDLKKLKSAISKQAFAQKPNGWNRLDTLFSKGKAGGTPTSTNKEYYNGEIPFLSINDITKQGKYVRYTENHLSRSGLENSSAWVVPEYSLIISMYASVGLVTINEVPITTSQAMFAMQLRDKDLLDYLYYYLSYFKYRHIHKYLETGTQSNINADIVRGIMIPTYGHSRNMKIASTLQGIDAKIDNELSVLKLFNRQKNYLLSQMFI